MKQNKVNKKDERKVAQGRKEKGGRSKEEE